jgi:hypothetical protein
VAGGANSGGLLAGLGVSLARRLLGEPAERTPLAHALLRAGTRVGVTPYNWRMLKSTRHPRLHVRARDRVADLRYVAREPQPVSDADVALCERLVAAYAAALGGRPGDSVADSGVWAWIYETRQRELAQILAAGDAGALARELASMFRSMFVLGMAPGALIDHSRSFVGGRIWRVKSVDGLISLAEALAIAAVQDAEQGSGTRALDDGPAALVERIEAQLGYAIDFPDVGAAHGVAIDGRLLTIDSAEQIYCAVRVEQALRRHLPATVAQSPRIVEIGGGYGATAHWLLAGAMTPSRYTIVDLPIVNVLQGYFLSRTLGEREVSLFGEDPARVVLLPNCALHAVQTPFDALVNKDSMPEMPKFAALEYLRWARSSCDGVFFSCNQESTQDVHGAELGMVPRLVEQAGGYTRLRRDLSWVRAGYVEEIYAVAGADRASWA